MEEQKPTPTDEEHQDRMAELEEALREADEAAKKTVEEFEAGELSDLPITADGELTPEIMEAYAKFMRSQQPKSWYTKKRFRFTPAEYRRRKIKNKRARRARKITRNAYRGR